MPAGWDDVPKDCQLELAEGAMQRACGLLPQQAESLAGEIELGEVEDRGGPDTLRPFARLIRLANLQSEAPAGRC